MNKDGVMPLLGELERMTKKHKMVLAGELESMADTIETRGWCQNNFMNYKGNVCILGSRRGGIEATSPSSSVIMEALGLKKHPADWNDGLSPNRGMRTVINRLRKSAARLREEAKPNKRTKQ